MQPRIETKATAYYMGLICETTQKNNTIPQLWDRYMEQMEDLKKIALEAPCYGICLEMDNCENFNENTPFKYMAASIVAADATPLPEMEVITVEAAKYAIFEHHGSLETLGKTYNNIFGKWLQENKLEPENKKQLEVYGEKFKYGEADSVLEIWIPVK